MVKSDSPYYRRCVESTRWRVQALLVVNGRASSDIEYSIEGRLPAVRPREQHSVYRDVRAVRFALWGAVSGDED